MTKRTKNGFWKVCYEQVFEFFKIEFFTTRQQLQHTFMFYMLTFQFRSYFCDKAVVGVLVTFCDKALVIY